jgi:hypothetical protein
MLLLFLIGHELGHLRQGHDQRSFGAFVDPQAPVETRLGNAVVKLTRHARELAHFGFTLPGSEKALDESSEIGRDQARWRDALQDLELNHARWFADESAADEHATAFVQQVLDRVAATDPDRSDRLLIVLITALFAAALYHWQRDLGDFLRKLGIDRLNAQLLTLKMMESREHYVHAGELFGPVHRLTMLRAILAINGWLDARGATTTKADVPVRRIELAPQREPLEQAATHECLQREYLLRIHIDAANKIAILGSATGWMMDMDDIRGTQQLFMMQFESLTQSVNRLRAML